MAGVSRPATGARGQAEPALAISRAGAAPRLLAKACEEPRGFASDERRHAVQLADESASARRQRNVSGLRCASAAHLPTNQLPTPASASDWGFHEEPEVAASEPCARCLSRGSVGARGACEAEAAAVCWSGHKGWMGYESDTVRSGGRALGSDVDLRSCVLELDPVARSTVPSGSFPSGAPHVWSRAGVRTLTSHAAGGPTVAPPSAIPHPERDCEPTNGSGLSMSGGLAVPARLPNPPFALRGAWCPAGRTRGRRSGLEQRA
jgi:hypothetical protein